MEPCLHVVYTRLCAATQMWRQKSFCQSSTVQLSVRPCEWQPQFAALGRQGAAPGVFYCCCGSPASTSGTSIVTRGYFSSCCLCVVSYQSVCSDPVTLTSSFPPNCCHWPTGYFPPLGTIFCKTLEILVPVWRSQQILQASSQSGTNIDLFWCSFWTSGSRLYLKTSMST